VTVEFVADKAGTFTFSCSVYCGKGHRGMKGELVVSPRPTAGP
jgi:cytochrome c oxidase subunit 2